MRVAAAPFGKNCGAATRARVRGPGMGGGLFSRARVYGGGQEGREAYNARAVRTHCYCTGTFATPLLLLLLLLLYDV